MHPPTREKEGRRAAAPLKLNEKVARRQDSGLRALTQESPRGRQKLKFAALERDAKALQADYHRMNGGGFRA